MPEAPSRRGKWLTNFKKSLPAAGNRFPTSKSHFPWREIVFQLQKVISRGGKPFFNFEKSFPVAGNRFSTSKSHFPRRETVFQLQKVISRRGKASPEKNIPQTVTRCEHRRLHIVPPRGQIGETLFLFHRKEESPFIFIRKIIDHVYHKTYAPIHYSWHKRIPCSLSRTVS